MGDKLRSFRLVKTGVANLVPGGELIAHSKVMKRTTRSAIITWKKSSSCLEEGGLGSPDEVRASFLPRVSGSKPWRRNEQGGVHGFVSGVQLTAQAHVTTPGLPHGGKVSLTLSAGPIVWPQELEKLHWFTAAFLFPSFWSSQAVVCSKHTQRKERPMNPPNWEVVLNKHQHSDTCFVLKWVSCASVEQGYGLCRCLQWRLEHRAFCLSVGDPVQACLQLPASD